MTARPGSDRGRVVPPVFPVFSVFRTVTARARAQSAVVAAYTALSALLVTAALLAPVALTQAADAGMGRAVGEAGAEADLVFRVSAAGDLGAGSALQAGTAAVTDRLPPRIAALAGDPVPVVELGSGRVAAAGTTFSVRRVVAAGSGAEWTSGRAPSAPGEAGVSGQVADALAVVPGDTLRTSTGTLRISGVFRAGDPRDPLWRHVPALLGPRAPFAEIPVVAVLAAPPAPLEGDLARTAPPWPVAVRLAVDPGALRVADLVALRRAVVVHRDDLARTGEIASDAPTLASGLPDVLTRFERRYEVARSQVTTVFLGLAAAAVLVLHLAAGLLVAGRHDALRLERARGASVASVAVRAAAESLAVALVAAAVAGACAAAVAAGAALPPGLPAGRDLLPAGLVLTAVVATPVLAAVRVAATSWDAPRVATDPEDRLAQERARRAGGIAAQALVVILAAGAVAAAGVRGFEAGGDLFVSAAPLLLAAACTVLVLRAVPPALRAVSRAASRGRSLVPLVAASRAAVRGAPGAVAPVLVLVVTAALAVFSAVQSATVTHARDHSVATVLGADVRVDAPAPGYADWIAARHPGTDVAGATVVPDGSFTGGSELGVTLFAVDVAALSRLPRSAQDPQFPRFAALAPAGLVSRGDPVPALLDPRLTHAATALGAEVFAVGSAIPLSVAGTSDLARTGPAPRFGVPDADVPAEAPVVVVDRETLRTALGLEPDALPDDVVWLGGSGAARAAEEPAGDRAVVTTRAGMTASLRADPLTGGVHDMLRGCAWAFALLGAVSVALTVLAGAPGRLRVLAVLRTLGVPRRAGRGLVLTELAPVLAAAVAAGCLAGVLLAWVLTPAQGLEALANGTAVGLVLPWWPFLAVPGAAAAALLAGAWLEERRHRRPRIGEVLRTG